MASPACVNAWQDDPLYVHLPLHKPHPVYAATAQCNIHVHVQVVGVEELGSCKLLSHVLGA